MPGWPGRECCTFLSIWANILGDSALNVITGEITVSHAQKGVGDWMQGWTLILRNSLCYCGSSAKCISQNSKAQVMDRVSRDVSPPRDSTNQPDCFLLNRTNSISPAKILIYEFSSDKLLKRELSGCRGASSAVKQMWGKPFFCGNEQVSNLQSASEGVQRWYVIQISENYMILECKYLRFRTEMWQICWHNVCTLLHSIWQKVMWNIWRVHLG